MTTQKQNLETDLMDEAVRFNLHHTPQNCNGVGVDDYDESEEGGETLPAGQLRVYDDWASLTVYAEASLAALRAIEPDADPENWQQQFWGALVAVDEIEID